MLIKCHIARGELDEAHKILRNFPNADLQEEVSSAQQLEKSAKKAIQERDYEAALSDLGELIRSCTHSVEFICLKIECLHQSLKVDKACEYIEFIKQYGGEQVTRRNLFQMWVGRNLLYIGK